MLPEISAVLPHVLGVWINRQIVFNGVVSGLVFGLLAMGIVLIYRSTRVINFAVGNMGLIGSILLPLVILNYGWNFWIALPVALLVGTLFGIAVELTVVRRLFHAPRVILLVATVGVAQLAQLIIINYPDIDAAGARYPVAIDHIWDDVYGVRMKGSQLTILIVVPLLALGLGWLMNRTTFGKSVAASADNPDLSRLAQINPKVVSTMVWTIAGFLATLSMVLLSGSSGGVSGLSNLGPNTLGRAMVAAVLAGMTSFPRAVFFGIVIGVLERVLQFNFLESPGLLDFLLLLLVLGAMYFQSRDQDEEAVFSFAPKVKPIPHRLQDKWWVKNMSGIAITALFAFAAFGILLVDRPSKQLLYATIICFAVCGASVTVITGWAGQLSLSQMSFAGIGAMSAAALNRGAEMDFTVGIPWSWLDWFGIPWSNWDFFDVQFQAQGIPFMLAIPLATLFGALAATLIGVTSLRLRGLYLAISTFVFALACQQYLYKRPFFSDGSNTTVNFRRGDLFGWDLSAQRNYYWVCLGFLAIVVVVLARLRRSGIGRTIIAVRDNVDTASAYTVNPTRAKLSAFALAGAVAALGGALLSGLIQSVPLTERFFQVGDSLAIVGLVVIGGVGSVMGAVLGALWVVGIPAFFPDNQVAPLFGSSIGLLIVLMYFPGGLIQIAHSARDGLLSWVDGRLPPDETVWKSNAAPVQLKPVEHLGDHDPVLIATDMNVRFGGNHALRDVSLDISPNQIVGLIGTNGAGKSTFMNAIGGYIPATGRVELAGKDLSKMSAPRRAKAGLGRTFQAAGLFPELTVRETVQVALEARGRTPFITTALFLPPSGSIERKRKAEADELINFLGLGRYADALIADLSTGTRRIVELAGLLALDARVLCLDEPTAGVAQRETEAFGPLIKNINKELGASMLVIEHDMPLIMNISDKVYCLEAGEVIAEGLPNDVRNNPLVVSSYLGTDTRAIDRSDS